MSEPTYRPARQLVPGDRIAKSFLPEGEEVEVLFVRSYNGHRNHWTFVAFEYADGIVHGEQFLAAAAIPLAHVATDPNERTTAVAEAKPDTLGVPMTGRSTYQGPDPETEAYLRGVRSRATYGHSPIPPAEGDRP